MTWRSVFLGLLGAAFVCGFCFVNDRVLQQTYLVGNNLPVAIFGGLFLFVLLVNPLLGSRALSGRELAVVLALVLAACCIPGGGFMRQFAPTVVMPFHLNRTQANWQEQRILDRVPEQMLVDPRGDEDRVVTGYVQGRREGAGHIAVADVPWKAWMRPVLFWVPITLTLWFALLGLSVAMHRQWSRHERLPYPIARFTEAFLPGESGAGRGLLRNRWFWVGALIVFGIHLNNLGGRWFPGTFIAVPTRFNLVPLADLLPGIVRGGGRGLFYPTLYATVVGLAFLIPRDVSLSFGIGPLLWYAVVGVLAGYGVNLMAPVAGTSYFAVHPQGFALFGANVGVALAIAYTGRKYYGALLRQGVGLAVRNPAEPSAVWGTRAFLLMTGLFVVELCFAGIAWPLAVLYTAFMIIGFVVLSRTIAETGLIYLKCYFWPCVLLYGLFGARTLGVQQILLLMLFTTILFMDPREALMPFMTNALKVLESRNVRLGRPALWAAVAIVIGLAVAIPVTVYLRYDMGNTLGDGWATYTVPRNPFENAVQAAQRLDAYGTLASSEEGTVLSRMRWAKPSPICMITMAAGFLLVLLCTAARLRFPRWPLHPLMFVTWAATPLRIFWASYFLGWLIKTVLMNYGGNRSIARVRPFMIGIIAGEILGALVPSLIGTLYFLLTNQQPLRFAILPG